MAFEQHLHAHTLPGAAAATTLVPRTPVKLGGTSALLIIPAASANEEPFGVTGAATHLAGEVPVVYFDGNIVKAVAIASTGAGALLSVGSTNGGVIPQAITASAHWVVGQSLSPAAAGEIVSVFVKVKKA